MKKAKKFIAFMVSCFLLSGCGAEIPELTEEQTETVTQYATYLLLKYDRNYDSGVLSEEELEEMISRQIPFVPATVAPEEPKQPAQEADQIPEELIGGESAAEPVDNRTLAEFFGLDGIDISYTGYLVVDSYPQGDTEEFYFAMDALPDMQLLVLQFQVTNQTSEPRNVDILNQEPRFRIFIDGGSQINASATLLMDDLKSMQTTLEAGESINEVVIVEVTQEEAELLTSGEAVSLELVVKTAEDSISYDLSE